MTLKRTLITTLFTLSSAVFTAPIALAADFSLTSPTLAAGSTIGPDHYWNNFGCSGKNVMPKLDWNNPPTGTKSFAVTFYDKDAPTGSGFWHWVAYNIGADVRTLPGGVAAGLLPTGTVEGHTDLGTSGYFGPCPPEGREHTYTYTVHALKVAKLPVDASATPALVGFYIWQNTLGQASLSVKAGPRP